MEETMSITIEIPNGFIAEIGESDPNFTQDVRKLIDLAIKSCPTGIQSEEIWIDDVRYNLEGREITPCGLY